MIRRIEALGYRCLRYLSQDLDRFQVLVGPNGSGKSTFLDVVGFLSDLVNHGPEKAVGFRTEDYHDLVWGRAGERWELALELEIPAARRALLDGQAFDRVRYEAALGLDAATGALAILAEKVLLKDSRREQRIHAPVETTLFPVVREQPETILTTKVAKNTKTVVNKVPGSNDNFYDETGRGWDHAFKLGPLKSALGNLPDDESKFPVSTWLKAMLLDGVQRLTLNSELMRRPSRPGQPRQFRPDGSNLPWVVHKLRHDDPVRFHEWVRHVQTALPEVSDIDTEERAEDRSRYLVLRYGRELAVPSWAVSDGTLRLLALTLPAYLKNLEGVFLIEEPENGIHPRAVETMLQSLSAVYDAQVLLATHSPVILSMAEPSQILCFSRTESGVVDVVRGNEHPALRDWRRETSLGVLFAGGVLG
ncbi:AAA family ATPase [bacterium]|nr:AAA family ATPase [bacterium]